MLAACILFCAYSIYITVEYFIWYNIMHYFPLFYILFEQWLFVVWISIVVVVVVSIQHSCSTRLSIYLLYTNPLEGNIAQMTFVRE